MSAAPRVRPIRASDTRGRRLSESGALEGGCLRVRGHPVSRMEVERRRLHKNIFIKEREDIKTVVLMEGGDQFFSFPTVDCDCNVAEFQVKCGNAEERFPTLKKILFNTPPPPPPLPPPPSPASPWRKRATTGKSVYSSQYYIYIYLFQFFLKICCCCYCCCFFPPPPPRGRNKNGFRLDCNQELVVSVSFYRHKWRQMPAAAAVAMNGALRKTIGSKSSMCQSSYHVLIGRARKLARQCQTRPVDGAAVPAESAAPAGRIIQSRFTVKMDLMSLSLSFSLSLLLSIGGVRVESVADCCHCDAPVAPVALGSAVTTSKWLPLDNQMKERKKGRKKERRRATH